MTRTVAKPVFDPRPLELARLAKGLTIARLAASSGFSVGTVHRTLRGKHSAARTVKRLAELLGVESQSVFSFPVETPSDAAGRPLGPQSADAPPSSAASQGPSCDAGHRAAASTVADRSGPSRRRDGPTFAPRGRKVG